MKKRLQIEYREVAWCELTEEERRTMEAAIAATERAYAPYSHFRVGAAIRMEDGSVVSGNNQENIAYPSGLCAERVAIFAASSQHPNEAMSHLAIVGRQADGSLTAAMPCGACRQSIAEYEMRQQKKIEILAYQGEDKIIIFEGIDSLLPFAFSM